MEVNPRYVHPYYMYEEMLAQSDAVRQLISRREEMQALTESVKDCRRYILTGCGTSFHAALAGEAIARCLFREQKPVRAVQASDLAHNPWGLGPDDTVIALTHSGSTHMVLEALNHARRSGAGTFVITGFPTSPAAMIAHRSLATGYPHERSWAHTISYTLQVTALLMFLATLTEQRGPVEAVDIIGRQLKSLPTLIEITLDEETQIACVAREIAERGLWLLGGTSTGLPVALEAALKAVETHYTPAVGMELEQLLHGHLVACGPQSAVTIVGPTTRVARRVQELLAAAARVGAHTLVLASEQEAQYFRSPALALPACHEVLYPIVHTVALHMLTYHTALIKGVNPDLIRRDDPPYREARSCYA